MISLNCKQYRNRLLASCLLLSAVVLPSVRWGEAIAQDLPASRVQPLQITVNSAADGPVLADAALTLREAIELTNGTLRVDALSAAEQQQIRQSQATSKISFDLPVDQTTIELTSLLPAIVNAGLIVDGATQAGYDANGSATAEIAIPVPIVTIRPADGIEVFRGLTVAVDNVEIRGLSLYGFTSQSQITNSTPPADIFISHRPYALNRETPNNFVGAVQDTPPKDVVIENNWLGLPPDESIPTKNSSFGVSVFDGDRTRIHNNRIQYHNGSGVITGRTANNLEVTNNIIVGNGWAGMPDAIRLDGSVDNGLIDGNLLCGNDGSSVFLFKPEGAVTITNNTIRFNGQRLRRAAVYVMGSNHRIENNSISNQKGGGVVVTAFGQGPNTQSVNNVITGNRINSIEGLSIDLNTRRTRTPQAFQKGDGPNPRRNSANRRQDTGNGAVDAPRFISNELFVIDGRVVVRGQADPGSTIELYQSTGDSGDFGPLSEPIGNTTTDGQGAFELVLTTLQGGEVLSAIATDPRYGTSEPAMNTVVRSLDSTQISRTIPVDTPQCTTAPTPPQPQPIEPPPVEPPEIIQLEVPRNVHFALDQDFVSEESARVLDKVVEVLKKYPTIVIDLHGHTDSRASQAYNQDLARRRSESVRQYLLRQGIGAERMTLRSFGETALLVEETNLTNFARNRRVEIVFEDVRGADITFVNQEQDLQIEP
ncbi:MAG: OmpA family protein [Cyanobacteria bacterium J06621_3]